MFSSTMSDQNHHSTPPETTSRPVGGTEYSWCKAVPIGTGTTTLALLFNKPPDMSILQNALVKILYSHPILCSKLHFHSSTNTFSLHTPRDPHLEIAHFDIQSTAQILQPSPEHNDPPITPFQRILEHEMNNNTWDMEHVDPAKDYEADVLFASVYCLSDAQHVVVLRIHTGVCDRTAAVGVLRELPGLVAAVGSGGGVEEEYEKKYEVSLGIEDLIPHGKATKPFWARGVDLLGYSLNSFRLANLEFVDAGARRSSQVARLQMNEVDTRKLLDECKAREIKLCGALAAAALLAAKSSKNHPELTWEKYGVVTLTDCRSLLEPPLSAKHPGFYHSAILNTHDVCGDEEFWDLAKRCYTTYANAKNWNKHFTDMNDLNFLMCKAIDNPGLTPSSSLRTALISVFEDVVIDESSSANQDLGLEDYLCCASTHGVGPSIAMFNTVRDGKLDTPCVYPSPLHSREQMQKLIDDMKRLLVENVDADSSEPGN